MDRPSADQNGSCAPSVPVMGCAEGESNGLDHSMLLPCASSTTSSRVLPSGDTFGNSTNCVSGGGTTEEMSKGGRKLASRRYPTSRKTTAIMPTAATIQATPGRLLPAVTTGVVTPACAPPSTIQFNSLLRSRALCQRSSGSLAKHFLMTWSKLSGVIDFVVVIDAGSFSKIADATLSCDLPSKALRPVTASYNTAPNEKMSL